MNEFICHVIYHGFVLFVFVCACVHVCGSECVCANQLSNSSGGNNNNNKKRLIRVLVECLKECICGSVRWSTLSENEKNNKSFTRCYQDKVIVSKKNKTIHTIKVKPIHQT